MLEANVTAVAIGRNKTCWAGSSKGVVYLIRKEPFRVLRMTRLPFKTTGNRVMRLFEDSRQRLWIATMENGLYRLDPGEKEPRQIWYRKDQMGGTNTIRAIAEDRQHRIWIGTDDGVLVAPKGNFRHVVQYRSDPDSDNGLSSHAVKSLLEDRSGNIWIGTWEAGLNVMYRQSEQFRTLLYQSGKSNGLLARKVTAIGGNHQGGLWLGSNVGLTHWQPRINQFDHIRPPRISGRDINLIYNQPTDRALVGVWNRGYALGDTKSKRQSFPGPPVTPLAKDYAPLNSVMAFCRSGTIGIWVSSTTQGVFRIDRSGVINTPDSGEKSQTALRRLNPNALCETADGTLWLGMFNSGLVAYDLRTGTTRHYKASEEAGDLSGNQILALHEDAQHRLWIGTNGAGLNLFDSKTNRFSVYTTEQGLANNTVKGILEDKRGHLWISTNNGLSRLEPDRQRFTTFSVADGLPSQEFMVGACYRSPDGHLYFGSLNGLVYFHPDSIVADREPLPVFLTGLRLFNRPVAVGIKNSPLTKPLIETTELTLRHDQSVFTIEFLALSFRAAPKLQYAYRLDNFDPDWNYVGTQRSATYTNLNPGIYTFRVKAANGTWSDRQA